MIPILFDRAETAFDTNGLGRLADCLSCVVTEERNGMYECELVYPITGRHFGQIEIGSIIYATHDDTKQPQPFDIYKRSAVIDGTVTFYARHIAYRLANVVLKPFEGTSCAHVMELLPQKAITPCPFTFWTNKAVSSVYKLDTPRSIWDILGGSEGSILDVYGKGTWEFDGWTARLYLNRGRETDVQIRYGKNLTELEHVLEGGDTYNAVVPFWKSEEDGTVITLPEWLVVSEQGTGSEVLATETPEIIQSDAGEPIEVKAGAGVKAAPLDLSEKFEEPPTADQLREEAQRRLENGKPWELAENLTINFVPLWETEEYKDVAPLQRVGLCDTVSVLFPALGVEAKGIQIIKTVYNTLMDRYDSMELGQPKVSFASLIKQETVDTVLKQVPSTSFMAAAIEKATALITGGTGGHVVMGTDANGKPNEILIMDTEDVNTAVNVLRINKNGIGFSSTGYNGPFKSAWTLDGSFVADFITAGVFNADLIKAGLLTDATGENWWNIDTGKMHLKDLDLKVGKDEVIAEINASEEGVKIKADKINLYGSVSISDLDSAAKKKLNDAEDDAADAKDAVDEWTYSTTTFIDGGKIYTGTIKAAQIDVTDLFAQNITASGTISGATLSGATGSFSGTITSSSATITGGSVTISDSSNGTARIQGGVIESWKGSNHCTLAQGQVECSYGSTFSYMTYNSLNFVKSNGQASMEIGPNNITVLTDYGIRTRDSNFNDRWMLRQTSAGEHTDAVCLGNNINYTHIYSTGNVFKNGTSTYFSTTSGSDERLKKDKRPLTDAYEQLFDEIGVRSFRYIQEDEETHGTYLGMMAQEVERLAQKLGIPEDSRLWSSHPATDAERYIHGGDSTYQIDYLQWVPLTIHMVQKANQRIGELESRLKRLEEMLCTK